MGTDGPNNEITKSRYSPEYYRRNRDKMLADNKQWRVENRERYNELQRAYERRRREKVLGHYGGTCACCGESQYEFLTLEHINGGGRKHRQAVGSVYREIVRLGFPEGYAVLCWNCNSAKGLYGFCPHERQP